MAENLWQTNAGEARGVEEKRETFSGAPPPPQDVRVRTMRSDLEAMTKSGGSSLPVFQSVKVEKVKPRRNWDFLWRVGVAIVSVAALLGGSYLIYDVFSGGGRSGGAQSGGSAQTETGIVPPQNQFKVPSGGAEEGMQFVHSSLLGMPAESILPFVVRGPAESATELKTFSQGLTEFLVASAGSAKFIELRMRDKSGRDLTAIEVLVAQDALILPEEFLASKFNPDPTFFVHSSGAGKDKNFFTGYVLALKPSENWLFLKDETAKLEWSGKIENFFLKSSGAKSGAGFEDAVINSQPARKLQFSSGEVFVYGWFRGHLILSASEEGFKEAVGRL